ncbi:two-component system, OmpR family, sensor histidine kinase BaeS [Lentzea xinjiangensis]|uniref:histidine kinase n=1 Tax=Lentzea xinjiangensis TaxID=402600 RepID=A0A1H9VA57_9PSEU|nr:HAMP domain-containing sensor histidine kinase [Lentzea xinjiangensis]SES18117.1 two-component system, OmpR family, sensor histidine kinase BaeS [Lentzea xinjiangensis]
MNSLLVRFFLFSLVIAACSIAVTAWLASQATTGTIRQEQGEALETDAQLVDELLEYAATHRSWADAKSEVDGIAQRFGRRIALTDRDGRKLADTGDENAPELPVTPRAVIDPLNVNGKIDPRAVGPFKLTDEEYRTLHAYAEQLRECNGMIELVEAPNGRPRLADLRPGEFSIWEECQVGDRLYTITATEKAAYGQLQRLFTECLERRGADTRPFDRALGPMRIDWEVTIIRDGSPEAVACMDSARREQLRPFVAEPAQLFLTSPTGGEPVPIDLSTTGATRITLVALGILALAGFASWLTATQLVRPIRALTAATKRTAEGDRTARVDGGAGEIGELARSFNAMSEKLAETERQRQAMVSDVAHELRTPLGTITGWLEATQDGLAEPDPHLIGLLLEESLLLQRLVDDLHDLAQADAGTLRLHPEPIALDDVVDQVVNAQRNREVLLRAETTPVHVTADPVRLRQALGNLVANAVRYTPPDGEVVVRLFQERDTAVLEVRDTGTGIAPEDLPHVFDRFWRADKSRSRRTGGSGLGLAITRHLVEAHGGTVSVTSALGRGSVFRIGLPADSGEPAPAERT